MNAILLLPLTALSSEHRSRQISPGKGSFHRTWFVGLHRDFRAGGSCARPMGAPFQPATTSKETGAMSTQYFARPKLQLFGVTTTFVVRRISLSDLIDALRLGWED